MKVEKKVSHPQLTKIKIFLNKLKKNSEALACAEKMLKADTIDCKDWLKKENQSLKGLIHKIYCVECFKGLKNKGRKLKDKLCRKKRNENGEPDRYSIHR